MLSTPFHYSFRATLSLFVYQSESYTSCVYRAVKLEDNRSAYNPVQP
jgi:hypothetical protein